MKKILLLNPLKDIPYWGLTTHAINVFPRLPAEEFESFAFFSNPDFASGSLHQVPYQADIRGILWKIRMMRKLEPNILYGTGSITEFFIFLFRPRSAKYVVAWHGPYDKAWLLDIGNYSFRARVAFWIGSYLLRRADLVACDTEFIARSVRKHFPGKPVAVTLNGVDGELYNLAKRDRVWLEKKFSLSPGQPMFVFIGHLIRRKRPELFVELARHIPEALFLMIGREGLYKVQDVATWEKDVMNLAWSPSAISQEEMPKLLASVSGLICPSLEEPFGLAVVEAMASGAVVVATRSGALPELIEDNKEGFLIDEGSDELKNYETVLRRVIEGGAAIDEIRKRAAAKTEEVFNWDGVAKRYEEAFRSMIK
jgi:glycosyltransferase involved in cell wall biosynthesis